MTRHGWEPEPVLVGVDGSEESTRAVRWAAREAALLDVALTVVHTWVWPLMHVPLGGSPLAPPGAGLQTLAEQVLADAAATARSVAPGLRVETELVIGEATTELLRRAPGVQLVVVGNRGLGGFTGLLLGSTGIALSARSPRPVAVVRGTSTSNGPVIVGVDPAQELDTALVRGLGEARLRGVGVVAVHAWTIGLDLAGVAAHDVSRAEKLARDEAGELVDKIVAQATADVPEVPVEVRLGSRSAAAELIDASHGAQLVVVGSRGCGPLRGALLGSTTHAVIHHAACPVLVER